MKSRPFLLNRVATVLFVLGSASLVSAQQTGPMAPASQGSSAATPTAPAQAPPALPQAAAQPAGTSALAATPAPSRSPQIEVPSGTHIPLVLHNAISTRSARAGAPFYFETLFPIMIGGHVAIPAGSYISGEVTESKRPGRVKGRGELMIKLTTMILPNSYMVNLNATPSNAGTGGAETVNNEGKIVGDSDKGSDVGTVVKSTAAGAGLGGIATQSGTGAGIGAGIGAAVGLGAVLLSRGPDAELPRGSTIEAVIDRPIYLDADKVQFTGPGQASTLAGPAHRHARPDRRS